RPRHKKARPRAGADFAAIVVLPLPLLMPPRDVPFDNRKTLPIPEVTRAGLHPRRYLLQECRSLVVSTGRGFDPEAWQQLVNELFTIVLYAFRTARALAHPNGDRDSESLPKTPARGKVSAHFCRTRKRDQRPCEPGHGPERTVFGEENGIPTSNLRATPRTRRA